MVIGTRWSLVCMRTGSRGQDGEAGIAGDEAIMELEAEYEGIYNELDADAHGGRYVLLFLFSVSFGGFMASYDCFFQPYLRLSL